MNKKILLALAVVLTAAVSIPRLAAQDGALGFTSANLVTCINNDNDIKCANKIVITAGVSYGIRAPLQIEYVDSVTTVGGDESQTLEDPFIFDISKSEPMFVYALRSVDLVGYPHPTAAFQSYTIDPPRQSYTVTCNILAQDLTLQTTFSLSPDAPLMLNKTSVHQVTAKLVGKEPPRAGAPEFASYILFNWNNNFLLVPRAMVPANTSMNFASSVVSLLQRLLAQDQALLAGNQETAYLVSGMKIFRGAPLPGSGNLALAVMNPAVTVTTVSLEIDPAQVNIITNEAQGYITGADLLPFTAMAHTGTMKVQIQNAGYTSTDYMVTVTQCQPGVNPIRPQARTVNPGQVADLYFDVVKNDNSAEPASCLVSLTALTGRIFDSVPVYFYPQASGY